MILEFKTARNINGHSNFLTIDTDKKLYARESFSFYGHDAVVIKATDRKNMIKSLEGNGFIEVDRIK